MKQKYQVLIPILGATLSQPVTNVYILLASSSEEALKLAVRDDAKKAWTFPGHIYKKPVAIPFSHEEKEG